MKNKFFFLPLFLLLTIISCKKDDNNKVTYTGGTAPVLSSSYTSTSNLVLDPNQSSATALTFSWTNPDYQFSDGISSQDVNYTLQVDTTGSNFTNPSMQEISIAKDLSKTFTVKDFNTIFTKLGIAENMVHNIEFRLKAAIANAVPLYSNVVKMKIVPYLDVVVPIPAKGDLWIVGDATSNGWANPLTAPYDVSQKFTKVSSSLYELTINLLGGGGYKLIQDNGVWSTQYHMVTGTWDAGTFEKKDSDPQFPGPQSAGTYKISVNFKTGTYTVVKL